MRVGTRCRCARSPYSRGSSRTLQLLSNRSCCWAKAWQQHMSDHSSSQPVRDSAAATADAPAVFEARGLTKISALGVEEQRVNVIADFITPLGDRESLGDGYRVEARLVIWEADDIVQAPASALFRKEGGWALFVANNDRAVLRPVEIGWQNGLMAQVLGGVEPGQLVIVHPSDEIEHGISITPRDES